MGKAHCGKTAFGVEFSKLPRRTQRDFPPFGQISQLEAPAMSGADSLIFQSFGVLTRTCRRPAAEAPVKLKMLWG